MKKGLLISCIIANVIYILYMFFKAVPFLQDSDNITQKMWVWISIGFFGLCLGVATTAALVLKEGRDESSSERTVVWTRGNEGNK